MRILAVLTVRNEGAFLLEWLAHHRAIGFTDFLVFSNDCQDGTDTILDRLDDMGLVTHLRNDGPHKGGIQWAALKQADKHPLVANADWILALDIDEFVNIHTGNHQVTDLLAALPDATAITLTWRLFGNNGVVDYVDRLVTDQFQHAAPRIQFWPWRAAMFKTLYRNDGLYRKLGVHRPKSPDHARLDQARWFDGSGRELDDRFKRQQIFSPFGRDNWALVQLNHYPLGAMQSYILKAARGRAVHADGLGMSYWVERNWSEEADETILTTRAARLVEIEALKGDAKLAELHQHAVAWRHAQFESLMQQEPFRALFGRLLMAPPSVPVPRNVAQRLYRYAQSAPQPKN